MTFCSVGTRDDDLSPVEETFAESNIKLHLQFSTAATLTEGLKTDGDISTHRFERESFNKDFCVSEIIFLNEIVLFTLHSQGRQTKDNEKYFQLKYFYNLLWHAFTSHCPSA